MLTLFAVFATISFASSALVQASPADSRAAYTRNAPPQKKVKVNKPSQLSDAQKVSRSHNPSLKNTCQFLFWQVECIPPEQAAQESRVTKTQSTRLSSKSNVNHSSNSWDNSTSFTSTNHISAAEKMIGMNARSNRRELASKFERTFGRRIDPLTIPWCAAWANAVLADSGMSTTGSLQARSFINWGRPTARPQVGDVVILRRGRSNSNGHVGFFYGFVNDNGIIKVAILGGNQSKAVNVTHYPVDSVIAYRTAA